MEVAFMWRGDSSLCDPSALDSSKEDIMSKHDEDHCFWSEQQTPQRLSIRNARQARSTNRSRRQRAARETRP